MCSFNIEKFSWNITLYVPYIFSIVIFGGGVSGSISALRSFNREKRGKLWFPSKEEFLQPVQPKASARLCLPDRILSMGEG